MRVRGTDTSACRRAGTPSLVAAIGRTSISALKAPSPSTGYCSIGSVPPPGRSHRITTVLPGPRSLPLTWKVSRGSAQAGSTRRRTGVGGASTSALPHGMGKGISISEISASRSMMSGCRKSPMICLALGAATISLRKSGWVTRQLKLYAAASSTSRTIHFVARHKVGGVRGFMLAQPFAHARAESIEGEDDHGNGDEARADGAVVVKHQPLPQEIADAPAAHEPD